MILSISPVFAQESAFEKEVQFLLESIKNTECFFIRSTKVYSSAEALDHIQKKYDFFKKRIYTAEDFIEYSATKSILTGKYYYLQCGEDEKIKAADWLYKLLEGYREGGFVLNSR